MQQNISPVEISQNIFDLISLKLKGSLISEWLAILSNIPEPERAIPNFLIKSMIDFISCKEVSLSKIAEALPLQTSLVNKEFEVLLFRKTLFLNLSFLKISKAYKTLKNQIFEILECENISEPHESRHLDSEKRTLKFKITDGFLIYEAIEERKIDLKKIILKYKPATNPNNKSLQAFNLNFLEKRKLLIKAGTCFRRNLFLLNERQACILEGYNDLIFNESENFQENVNENHNGNQIEEEAIIEEFIEYMDEI